MYKLVLLVSLMIVFIACGDNNDMQERLKFEPIKIANVVYGDKNRVVSLAVDGNIYAVGLNYQSVNIGSIDTSGSYTSLATIQEKEVPERFGELISVDNNYILVGNKSPDDIFLYKVEDNLSVTQLEKIHVEDPSDSTEAGNMLINGDTIAVSEWRGHYNEETEEYIEDDKVVIYSVESNESVTKVQELKSDFVGSDGSGFGEDIALDNDTLAVSQRCYINIFTKDSNGTFSKSDSMVFGERDGQDDCYLDVELKAKHLVAHSRRYTTSYLYQLENGKVKTAQDISEDVGKSRSSVAFLGDTLIFAADEALSFYTMNDTETEIKLSKYSDINTTSTYLLNAGDKFFATGGYAGNMISVYDAYPLDKIFVYSDISTPLKVDEDSGVYDFYTIEADSISGGLKYTLSGIDASYFKVENNKLSNSVPFDYENPLDANGDNSYEISLDISDLAGNRRSIPLSVEVVNREYLLQKTAVANDNTASKELGKSISIDSKDVLVGANASAYLFDAQNDLTQLLKITPDSNVTQSSFGASVAKSGETILVGAPFSDLNDTYPGEVSLFKLDANKSIVAHSTIEMPSLAKFALFGTSVNIDDNFAVIGAPGRVYAYREPGNVFIYDIKQDATATLIQTLESPDSEMMDAFGETTALSDKYLLVGSPGHSYDNRADVGAVYLYKRETDKTVSYIGTITPDIYDQYFGISLAISGDYIVAGTQNNEFYLYKINSSGEHVDKIAKISNPDSENFGRQVSINGKDIFTSETSSNEGIKLYHYKIDDTDNVVLSETIENHTQTPVVSIDGSIALGDGFCVVGAPGADINVTDSGIIMAYQPSE